MTIVKKLETINDVETPGFVIIIIIIIIIIVVVVLTCVKNPTMYTANPTVVADDALLTKVDSMKANPSCKNERKINFEHLKVIACKKRERKNCLLPN